MASKQTRRSISVRGTTYAMLRDFCAEHDRSMSDVVEELLSRILESSADARPATKAKTVAPLVARALQQAPQAAMQRESSRPARPVEDRAAVRVDPTAPRPAPSPVPRAAPPVRPAPVRPGPARPVPVANAGRPAPTPATKVEGTQRGKHHHGDYRAIRF
jgi:hypothetical protein